MLPIGIPSGSLHRDTIWNLKPPGTDRLHREAFHREVYAGNGHPLDLVKKPGLEAIGKGRLSRNDASDKISTGIWLLKGQRKIYPWHRVTGVIGDSVFHRE